MDSDRIARIAELEEALARERERANRERERANREKERATREKERADNAEAREAPSGILEYIQNAEEELYSVFYKESDPDKLSSGGINSPNGKYYPLRLRFWADFETDHARLFDCLDEVFKDQALFPSLADVRGIRRDMSPDGAADELDLRAFIRTSIERPVTNIVKEYLRLRPHSTIQSITFKNNAYGLMPTDDTPREPSTTGPPSKRSSPTKRVGIPDRWGHACHNDEFQTRTPLFVGEYKAAHKLTPRMLHGVLSTPVTEAFFTQALKTEGETAADAGAAASAPKKQRVPGTVAVAHVLCQAFHYMITSGLEFGYVASGDGLIFLRVHDHDPKTLHYFVTIFPTPSMRDYEARRVAIRGMRTPRQTAVAYLCTFCLQTLDSQVRPSDWISNAEANLAQWPIPYEGIARPIASRPPRLQLPKDKDDDDDAPEGGGGMGQSHQPRLPIPAPSHSAQKHSRSNSETQRSPPATNPTHTTFMGPYVVEPPRRPYCTQACLRGLVRGLPPDTKCPNVELHLVTQAKPAVPRTKRRFHPIDMQQLRDRLIRQLDKHLERDCECLDKYGYFGRFGVLFKITLSGFGYTFVAKGVQATHRDVLEREVSVYRALETVQGRLIPVLLGVIDLARPFPLHSCARISQMMLLAWAGHDLTDYPRRPRGVDLELEMQKTEDELAKMGLRNDDVREANLTWNDEAGRVMHIDFDQAYLIFPHPPPQPSRKRRLIEDTEQGKRLLLGKGI